MRHAGVFIWNSCNTNPRPGGAGVVFQLAPAPAVQPGLFKPAGTEAPTDAALIGYQTLQSVQRTIGAKEALAASFQTKISKSLLLNY